MTQRNDLQYFTGGGHYGRTQSTPHPQKAEADPGFIRIKIYLRFIKLYPFSYIPSADNMPGYTVRTMPCYHILLLSLIFALHFHLPADNQKMLACSFPYHGIGRTAT